MHLRPTLLVLFALAAALPAQNATLEWQKRAAEVEYFPVPLGNHTLSELPVGRMWRLGAHQPTVLRLSMPAIVGEKLIPPGDHIVQLQRDAEDRCSLVGDAGLSLDGPLGKAPKPTKKLAIELQKAGAAKAGNQPVKLVVQFGESEWSSTMAFPGNKTTTVGGWKLAVFQLPAALLAARGDRPVAVAALQKDDETAFNLVLGKDEVKLVPWHRVARGINHGPVPAPNPTPSQEGSIDGTVEELKLDKPATRESVESLKASLAKGELVVELAFGDEAVRVRVPEPKVTKDKKTK